MFQSLANRAAALLLSFGVLAAVCSPAMAKAAPTPDGIVKVRSAYPFDETIARLKADVTRRGCWRFVTSFNASHLRESPAGCAAYQLQSGGRAGLARQAARHRG